MVQAPLLGGFLRVTEGSTQMKGRSVLQGYPGPSTFTHGGTTLLGVSGGELLVCIKTQDVLRTCVSGNVTDQSRETSGLSVVRASNSHPHRMEIHVFHILFQEEQDLGEGRRAGIRSCMNAEC